MILPSSYAVIGHPIAHSRSPWIHAAFARQTQQNISYVARLAPLDGFQASVGQFRAEGGLGLNVTVPFKNEAFALATQHSDRALHAQAVNTLIWTGQHWRGDNTDGVGLCRDLIHQGFALKDKRIVILGAGGAVQGLLPILLEYHPAEVLVLNRNVTRAQQLVDRLQTTTHTRLSAGALDLSHPTAASEHAFDGIIQATSSALLDTPFVFPALSFSPHAWCYDLVYGKAAEATEAWATKQQLRFSDGLGMLVEQAAESFWLWRNVRPETRAILSDLRQLIQSTAAPSH